MLRWQFFQDKEESFTAENNTTRGKQIKTHISQLLSSRTRQLGHPDKGRIDMEVTHGWQLYTSCHSVVAAVKGDVVRKERSLVMCPDPVGKRSVK